MLHLRFIAITLLSLFCCAQLNAEAVSLASVDDKKLASIQVHTVDELSNLIDRIDQTRVDQSQTQSPVLFVLHGEEARAFIKGNYSANQSVVDKTAKLTALGHVQIEVCETWMGFNNIDPSQMQPFVKPIRYAPARISDLIKNQNYTYF